MKKNFFSLFTDLKKFEDDDKNRIAEIVNLLGMILLTGFLFILLQRILFEEVPFMPEIILTVMAVSSALILLRYGKIYLSGLLIILSLFGLLVFLAVKYNGIHDYALMAIPGLLVVSALIFPKKSYYIFFALSVISVAGIGFLEINGVLKTKINYQTKIFDVIDVLVIISLTAISIRIFSERFKNSLAKAQRSEMAIKESEQKYRLLLSALPDLVFRLDSNGVFKDYSAPQPDIMLYKSDDFLGKSISDLLPPEVSAKTLEAIKNAVTTGKVEQFEYKLQVNEYCSDWEARVVALDKNEVVVVVRDITERKRTEEALKQSEAIFEAFMEYSPIYVFFKDKDTRAIKLSKNYEKMLKMPMQQILGKTMFELFPSDLAKSMTEDDLNIIKNGKMVKVREELEGRYYETFKFPIVSKGSSAYLAGFTIDITETKQYELQLKRYAEELKEANLSKERFWSIIAHDLRSPFLGILGSIQMLSTEYQMLSEEERQILINRVAVSIRKTFDLLENLLNWSRVQGGKILPITISVNLLTELFPTLNLLKDSALHKNVQIENRINPLHNVFVDKDMLRTIIRNLVSNAIKFSLPSGKVTIRSEEKEDTIVMSVEDAGIGMDGETLSSLFKPESAKSRLGTSNESGTGIGLLVCRDMIELNKGKIWVESREGSGTAFYFSLPVSK